MRSGLSWPRRFVPPAAYTSPRAFGRWPSHRMASTWPRVARMDLSISGIRLIGRASRFSSIPARWPDWRSRRMGDSSISQAMRGAASLLCRYDWRTGKEDKVYEGSEDAVSVMELSPDGRNMVTRGTYYKHPMHLWNTETGKILRSFQSWRVFFMPQARSLVRYSTRGCVIAPLEGDRPPPVQIEEPFSAMTFSSNEKCLVTVQEASTKERGAGLYLLKRRNAAGYPIEAQHGSTTTPTIAMFT